MGEVAEAFRQLAPPGQLRQQVAQWPEMVGGAISDALGITDAGKALRGEMTPEEARTFALTSALGLIPGAGAEAGEGERIIAAALRNTRNGNIFQGINHGDAFAKAAAQGMAGDLADGFMTNTGRFLSREEAAQLVNKGSRLKTEQISPKPGVFSAPAQNDDFLAALDDLNGQH